MKHVKDIDLFEARNFRDWAKYNRYLSKKYHDDEKWDSFIGPRNNIVSIFSEANQITITIKYNYTVSNIALLKLYKDFKNLTFKIYPSTNAMKGTKAIAFEVYDVPKSYFDQIDMEINAEKYNI